MIPSALAEVSARWLTDVLQASGVLGGGEVAAARPTRVGQDVGFVGELARFELELVGADADAPTSVVVKVPTSDPMNLATGQLLDAYRREQGFYRDGAESPVRVPKCWFADHDAETGAMALVLEDMSDWAQPDQTVGVASEVAAEFLGVVATHHAHWWGDDRLPDYGWLAGWDGPYCRGLGELARGALDRFLSIFGDVLPRHGAELAGRVAEQWEHIIDQSLGASELTMQHGDYRLDNLFVRGGEVALCDWGNTMHTGPGYDVAYFIGGSLEPDVCASESGDLVRAWHRELTARGVGISADDALRVFRGGVGVDVGAMVIIGGALDLGDLRGDAILRRGAVNAFGMLDAHGVVEEFGL